MVADERCPDHWRKAFSGEPTRIELPRGERLYKFISMPIVRERVLASPWWIRQRAFDDLQARARQMRVRMPDLVRAKLAIADRWNPGMDTVYIVVLNAAVAAWEGAAAPQPTKARDGDAMFIGRGMQVCVPQLTWLQVGLEYSGYLQG